MGRAGLSLIIITNYKDLDKTRVKLFPNFTRHHLITHTNPNIFVISKSVTRTTAENSGKGRKTLHTLDQRKGYPEIFTRFRA